MAPACARAPGDAHAPVPVPCSRPMRATRSGTTRTPDLPSSGSAFPCIPLDAVHWHPRRRQARACDGTQPVMPTQGCGYMLRQVHETPMTASSPSPQTPPDVPGYRLSRVIGRGGMSTVWLGTQLSLSREVAVKVMLPDALADEVSRRRFENEARTIARLE